VVARDAGTPPLSASFVVHVVVTDVNDHRPVFDHSVYDTDVTENVDPATYGPRGALVTVRATDDDLGTHGLVRYRLSTRSNAQFGQLFGVDAVTGDIQLLQAVDYERLPGGGSVVELEVEAHDEAGGGEWATATVRVRVHDVNDNAPTVRVESAGSDGDEETLRVVENSASGTLIGHVTVSDADTGDAGLVDCHVQHHNGVCRPARDAHNTGF